MHSFIFYENYLRTHFNVAQGRNRWMLYFFKAFPGSGKFDWDFMTSR